MKTLGGSLGRYSSIPHIYSSVRRTPPITHEPPMNMTPDNSSLENLFAQSPPMTALRGFGLHDSDDNRHKGISRKMDEIDRIWCAE